MKRLTPGWYILLYHEVSWEESCYIRSIGGTCPPDLFRSHLRALAGSGDLVSVAEGHRRVRESPPDGPLFSFWFDDGLTGVAKYAAPILEEFGVTGALSICSRFVDRSEFFWRFKLAYLNSVDGMRFLRSRLKAHGFRFGDSIRAFTLEQFSPEVLQDIDELFVRFTTAAQREDAYRLFVDRAAVRQLYDRGWCIANHSGGHYPISQERDLSLLGSEFEQCEAVIQAICGAASPYWVLPFDAGSSPDTVRISDEFRGDRHLVFVRDRPNTPESSAAERVLYRFGAPIAPPAQLFAILSGAVAD